MEEGNDGRRWARVKEVFSEVADLAPAERGPALERACGEDGELRREVEALLEAESSAPTFLDGSAPELAAADLAPEPESETVAPGGRVGAYRLLRRIGGGGMGRVFLAEREDEAFQQRVAVKVMRGFAAATENLRERFRAERQILANLGHPSIAKVFDGGVTEDGLPYLVMEFVDGEPIDRFCQRAGVGLGRRLELFGEVCSAVQHAHRHLVVHRDLKPSNVLVSADGAVKLLDFGIAKLLDPDRVGLAGAEPLTRTGLLVMTPEYAAPEQVRGGDVTTATDVYALGVILYELLAGVRPYDFAAAAPTEIERAICETDPAAPSTRVGDRRDPDRLGAVEPSLLRGDLDTIVLKALRKEPNERYESVRALADDLDRYQAGLPISARPSTWTYRARKFVRRNHWGVAAAALLLLTVLGGLVATTTQRNRAEREALTALQVTEFLVDLFQSNEPGESLGEDLTARQILERGEERLTRLEEQPEIYTRLSSVVGRVHARLGDFERAEPLLRRAIETAESDRELARTLAELGALLYERGDLEEAEATQRRALELRQRARPKQELEVAAALFELGKTLSEQREPEAERVFGEALALRERALGPEHPEIAETLLGMGASYTNLGACERAVPLFRRARKIFAGAEESRSLGVARSQAELAACFSDLGELADAESLIREVLAIYVPIFGEDHPSVMTQRNNLAVALARQGYYAEAEVLLRQLLESRRRSMGEGAYTGNTLGNLGALVMFRENYAEAEPILRETIALMREKFGPDHPQTVRRMNSLGQLEVASGELDEAEALFRQSLEILDRTERSDHPHAFVARRGLGQVLGARGRHAEAAARLRETAAGERRLLGDQHPAVAATLEELGVVLLGAGESSRSAAALRESLQIRVAARGESHPDTARTKRRLAEALIEIGDLQAAESLLVDALSDQEEKLRPENPQIAATRAALADVRGRQGRGEAAAPEP